MPRYADLEVRHKYATDNDWCELAESFPAQGSESLVTIGRQTFRISRRYSCGQDVHHITGGILGTRRYDLVTNLIHVCRIAHLFCERYTADGFTICAAAKIAKGEWDSQKLAEIMRVDSVRGWLETRDFEFEWARSKFLEIKEKI